MLKEFVWFTIHSWSYMKGSRREFFTGFWAAWRRYRYFEAQDRYFRAHGIERIR